jgi:hypothetical protein
MNESAKRHSDDRRSRENPPATSHDHDRDRSGAKSKAGQKAQEEAARTQPPYPGEPAGGE